MSSPLTVGLLWAGAATIVPMAGPAAISFHASEAHVDFWYLLGDHAIAPEEALFATLGDRGLVWPTSPQPSVHLAPAYTPASHPSPVAIPVPPFPASALAASLNLQALSTLAEVDAAGGTMRWCAAGPTATATDATDSEAFAVPSSERCEIQRRVSDEFIPGPELPAFARVGDRHHQGDWTLQVYTGERRSGRGGATACPTTAHAMVDEVYVGRWATFRPGHAELGRFSALSVVAVHVRACAPGDKRWTEGLHDEWLRLRTAAAYPSGLAGPAPKPRDSAWNQGVRAAQQLFPQ